MATFVILLAVCQFVSLLFACGPGGGGPSSRITRLKMKGKRIPDLPEHSTSASGSYNGPIMPNDPKLLSIIDTNIVFKDDTYQANSRRSIKVGSLFINYYAVYHKLMHRFFV